MSIEGRKEGHLLFDIVVAFQGYTSSVFLIAPRFDYYFS